jgi:hypothetical protein
MFRMSGISNLGRAAVQEEGDEIEDGKKTR